MREPVVLDPSQISLLCRTVAEQIGTNATGQSRLSAGNCAAFAVALHKVLGASPLDEFAVIGLRDEYTGTLYPWHILLQHNGLFFDYTGRVPFATTKEKNREMRRWDVEVPSQLYMYPVTSAKYLLAETKPTIYVHELMRLMYRVAQGG